MLGQISCQNPYCSQVQIMSCLHAAAALLYTRKLSFKTDRRLTAWRDDPEQFGGSCLAGGRAVKLRSWAACDLCVLLMWWLQLACLTSLLEWAVVSMRRVVITAQLTSQVTYSVWPCEQTLKYPMMCQCSSNHPACRLLQPKYPHM